MHSKRKIPDSWWTGWKAKTCTSFVLYLKVFKNPLYYLWHVRVLSIKPCLHTQLPEHNKSYRKVSRGWGHLITWNGPMTGHLNSFSASGGGNLNKNFPKIQMPGGLPGGVMLKLRFDWYIMWYRKHENRSPTEVTRASKNSNSIQAIEIQVNWVWLTHSGTKIWNVFSSDKTTFCQRGQRMEVILFLTRQNKIFIFKLRIWKTRHSGHVCFPV